MTDRQTEALQYIMLPLFALRAADLALKTVYTSDGSITVAIGGNSCKCQD